MTKKIDLDYDNRTGAEFSEQPKKSDTSKKFILFIFLFAIVAGSWIATQYIASTFYYQTALGSPLYGQIYYPWDWYIWALKYWDQYPKVFEDSIGIFYLSFAPFFLIAILKNYNDSMKLKADKYLQGSARWANLKDIQDAALLPSGKELKPDLVEWEYAHSHLNYHFLKKIRTKIWERKNRRPTHERKGVFVGSWIDPKTKKYWYLRDYSKTHVLMIAKTRAGKGVGPINDTVGSWADSMFVYDIKGELWALFSGRRHEMGQHVMRFAPRTRRRDMNAVLDKEGNEIDRKYENCKYFEDEKNGDDSMLSCQEGELEIEVVYTDITVSGETVKVYANAIDQERKPISVNEIEEFLNGKTKDLRPIRGLYDLNDPKKTVLFGKKLENALYNTVRWNPFDTIQYEGATEYYYQEKSKEQYTKDKKNDPNTPRGYLASRICNGDREIADIQNVTELIINPDGKTEVNHWTDSAKSLIQAAICYVIHNLPEMACPKAVDWMLSGMIDFAKLREKRKTGTFKPEWNDIKSESSDVMPTVYRDMMLGLDWQGKPYKAAPLVVREAKKQYARPKDEGGSVLSSAQRFFLTYSDTLVAEATSKSDFDIRQLMNMDKPCSLFMVVQPEDKDALKPVVRLLINRILRMLAADMHFAGGRSVNGFNHRLLLMIDEMPTLGKLDILQEALGYMAGYGLKAFMVTQDITQLKDNYGDKESIRANCQVKMYYATSNEETAREMSAEFGTTTRIKESVSISGEGLKKNRSRSIQETARPLLSVDECMNLRGAITAENGDILKAGAMAIKATGFPGIMGEQPLYFQNPELLRRAQNSTLRGSDCLLKKDTNGRSFSAPDKQERKVNLSDLEKSKKK